MSTFVLIHGAWHGAWCWYKIVPKLEAAGHTVIATDLPGHGRDKTPTSDITLKKYVEHVCGILDNAAEPVVLVGHSMGGAVITQTAEQRPDKIQKLVYLTAFLLPNGDSLLASANADDVRSEAAENLIPSADGMQLTVQESVLKSAFYEDCNDADITLAKLMLVPQAADPFNAAIQTSEENFGRVPRVYIECLQDKAILPAKQKALYTALPCKQVITMDCSHSPFFSMPEQLAANLLALA